MIFRHIQLYWCIFSHTHRHATRREDRGLPYSSSLFWKPKKVSWFWKEGSRFSILSSTNCLPLLPWKTSGCTPGLRHYFFCKTLHHRLNNCLVICAMSLCCVLHQTFGVFSTQVYLRTSSIFHANVKPSEALTRHVKNPATRHCPGHIGNLVQRLANLKCQIPILTASQRMLRTLQYLRKFMNIQPWHIQNTTHIHNPLKD